jgi:hypothetical protein
MKRNRAFSMERLEDRQLMAGDLAVSALSNLGDLTFERNIPVVPSVPAFSSNPGAAATLHLDFNGHFESQWGNHSNARTPVFSIDADTTTFSSTELATIKEVWQRVSEDFAPFNINVTTVNPGDFSNGKALRVAIGGSWQDWYGNSAGGVGRFGSFTSVDPNVVYVFRESDFGSAKGFAGTVSHEAGHAFGLFHQSSFDANGDVIEEYRSGTDQKGPIMGTHRDSVRTTWAYGQSSYKDSDKNVIYVGMQDDMAVIASTTNGFGYRPDDFGSKTYDAYQMGQLSSYGPISNIGGVISTTTDDDGFIFNVKTAGRISLQANVVDVGANLDARLSLFRIESFTTSSGNAQIYLVPISTADPSTSLSASLAANVTTGNYIAIVSSHGEYGDVGQYTLKGSFSQPLVVNRGVIVNQLPLATASITPTAPKIAQPTVTSGSLNTNAQLLTAAAPGRTTSFSLQSESNLSAAPTSLRAAAVDEVFATRSGAKTGKLSAEVFDLLALGV